MKFRSIIFTIPQKKLNAKTYLSDIKYCTKLTKWAKELIELENKRT